MAQILRQSTAVDVLIGPFLDLTDGATSEIGETPVVKLSKNGQALAAKSDVTVPVYDVDGYYNCEFDATDTNTVGTLILTVAKSATALPVRHEFQVVETVVYDSLYADAAVGYQVPIWAAAGSTVNLSATTVNLVNTATTLTNLPAITANWLTAAGINAGALNGKGDWNVGKTGYTLTPTTGLGDQTANITGTITTATNVTTVNGLAANVITAAATAADFTTEIQAGLATAAALATVDTVVDAIQVKTDQMVFTKANELDVNTQSINGATVVGDGNATPWDGA